MNKVTIRNKKTNEIREVSVDLECSCPIDECGQFYDLEEWLVVPDISAMVLFGVLVVSLVLTGAALVVGWPV